MNRFLHTIVCLLFVAFGTQAIAQNTLDMAGLTSASIPASAYSLRKLSSSYSGPAITVRRSSDNTTQDIGFTAGAYLDTVALKSFVGSGSGFVTRWYDQSGYARNLIQSNVAMQPAIINAGTIFRKNGQPALYHDAIDDGLDYPGTAYLTTLPLSVNIVAGSNSNYTGGRRALQGDGGYNWLIGPYGNMDGWFAGGWNFQSATVWSKTNVEAYTVIEPLSTPTAAWRNGVSQTMTGNNKGFPGMLVTGAAGLSAEPLNGFISEVLAFNTELSTTERQSLQANQALAYPIPAPVVYYVKPVPSGTGSGFSWADAGDLQTIINKAVAGDQIWVAAGTYLPSRDYNGSTAPGDFRTKTFKLQDGVKVYGGFTGTESLLSQRNASLNETVLSGDLGTPGTNTDNAYHVVIGNNLAGSTLLDGFTITNGNANGGGSVVYDGNNISRFNGGGMYNAGSSYTISNIKFINNRGGAGGAIMNSQSNTGYTLTIEDSKFLQNTSTDNSGSGAIYCENTSANINRSVFGGNVGGAIAAFPYCNYTIDRSVFVNNTGSSSGGAARMRKGNITVKNSVFANNSAANGGAIYVVNENNESHAFVYNCTFYNNSATTAGNAFWGPGSSLENCIFNNNTGTPYTVDGANSTTGVVYSVITAAETTRAGTGSLVGGTANFTNTSDLDGPDDIWGTTDDGLMIGVGSAAFNQAGPSNVQSFDIAGTPRPQFTLRDIGAYESIVNLYSSDATLSSLTTTAGALSPSFASETLAYSANVPNATASITVTPVKTNANAVIQIRLNGGGYATVASGSASSALSLNVGNNTIDVKVTAQDGTTIKNYTIIVVKAAPIPATALNFAGSTNRVSLGAAASAATNFTSASAFTIEGWVKLNGIVEYQTLFSNRGSGSTNPGYAVFIYQGKLYLEAYSSGAMSSTTIAANTWAHLAVTYNQGATQLFVNGVSAGAANGVNILSNSSPAACIGSMPDGWAGFDGSLDEVRIWNRALCQGEILNNMSGELASGQSGLVAYYKLNSGFIGSNNAGLTTATDASGNGYNGTLSGFTLAGSTSNWVGGTVTGTAPVFTAPTATITPGGPTTFCPSGSVTLTANSGTGYSYQWTKNGSPIGGQTGASYVASTGGNYTVIVSKNGCTATSAPVAVIVQDNVLPAKPTLADISGQCSVTVLTTPTTTDNCAGIVTGTTTDPLTYSAQGTYTITWKFDDGNGNIQTAAQRVIVKDDTKPVFATIPNITVNNTADNCKTTVTVPVPVVTDNCEKPAGNALNFDGIDDRVEVSSGLPSMNEVTIETWLRPRAISNWDVIMNYNTFSTGDIHFQFFPNGTLEFSIAGNSPTDQFTSATFENNKWYHFATVYSAAGKYVKFYLNGVLIDTRTYSYAGSTSANVPYTIGAWAPGNRYFDGDLDDLRIWNVVRTQAEIQASMNSTLQGTEAGLLAYYDFNQGTAEGNNAYQTTVPDLAGGNNSGSLQNFALNGSTSNWTNGAPTTGISLTNNFNNTSDASGLYNVGNTDVIWTAKDAAGNTQTYTQTITVKDVIAPVKPVLADVTAQCSKTLVAPTTTDNCSGVITGTTNAPLTYSAQGTYTITWTFTDAAGNSTTADQKVIIQDTTSPTFTLAQSNVTVALNASGTASLANYTTAVTATDNCTAVNAIVITQSPVAGTPLVPNVPTTVTLTATDAVGRSVSQTFTVTAKDQTPPIAIARNITRQLDASGNVTITADDINDGSSDNVGIASMTVSPNTFNCSNITSNTPASLVYNMAADDYIYASISKDDNQDGNLFVSGADWSATYSGSTPLVPGSSYYLHVKAVNGGGAGMFIGDFKLSDGFEFEDGSKTLVTNSTTFKLSTSGFGSNYQAPYVLWGNGGSIWGYKSAISPSAQFIYGPGSTWYFSAKIKYVGTPNTATLTVTDASGNVSTATANITIEDKIDPVAPVLADVTKECSATITAPTAPDNCSGVVTGTTTSPLVYTAQGNYTITWKFTDASGNFSTADQNVIVKDVTAPVITSTQANVIVPLNSSGTATLGNYTAAATAIDNCTAPGAIVFTQSPAPGTALVQNVPLLVTLTATDGNGQKSTQTFTVTATDQTAPIAIAKNIVKQLDASGNVTVTAAEINNGSSDNVGIASMTVSPNTFNCGNLAINLPSNCVVKSLKFDGFDDIIKTGYNLSVGSIFTLEYYAKNNGADATFDRLTSTTSDLFETAKDGTGELKVYSPSMGWNATGVFLSSSQYSHIAWSYNGSVLSLYKDGLLAWQKACSITINNAEWYFGGRYTRSEYANVSLDEIRLFNVARTAGQIAAGIGSCEIAEPTGIVFDYKLDEGTGSSVKDAISSRISTMLNMANSSWVSDNNVFASKGNQVLLTVTDASGNTSTASATVTVEDKIAPVAPVLADVTGECSITVTVPTASDNCSGIVTGTTASPLTYTAQGTYTIAWTFKDASGNITTATQKVIVKDITPPTIASMPNINVVATSAAGAVVNYVAPVGIDNCSGATTIRTEGLANGSTFPIGTTTVVYTVTDVAGLTASTSFDVTVTGIAPKLDPLSNITVNSDLGVCGAKVSFRVLEKVGIPASVITYSVAPGTVFPVGTTPVTVTATNAVGTSEQTFMITVIDVEKPVIVSSGDKEVSTDAEVCGAAVLVSATAADNCSVGMPIGTRSDGLALNALYPVGKTIITWTVTDVNGLEAIPVAQTISVVDNEKPVAIAHNITIQLDATGNAKTTAEAVNYGSNDACGIKSLVLSKTDFDCSNVGLNEVTLTVTDMNGNASSTTAVVTVEDVTSPVFAAVESIAVHTDAGVCGAKVVYEAPVATDNCSATTVQTAGLPSGSVFPVGTTVNTFLATDIAGNTDTLSFEVTVKDTEKPRFAAISDKFAVNDAGVCGAKVAYITPEATDNCSATTVQTAGLPSGSVFPIGTTINTFIATDASGNRDSISFTVTVKDVEKPRFAAISDKFAANDAGVCGAKVLYITPEATDNCSATTVQTAGLPSGSVFPIGTTINTFIATDASGNRDSISFTVTVKDTEKPRFAAISDKFAVNDAGVCGAKVLYITPEATDNCSATTVQTAGLPSGSVFPVGTTINTFIATDASGNRDSISFTVTVKDTEKPRFAAISDKFAVNDAGVCGAKVLYITPEATDNCSATTAQTAGLPSGSVFPVGTTINTFIATDASGNRDSISFTVTVKDIEKPKFAAIGNRLLNSQPGVCGSQVLYLTPKATDNCTVNTVQTAGLPSGSVFPVGTTINKFLATDASGNRDSISFTVTIKDVEKPKFALAPNIAVNTDLNVCGAKVAYTAPKATDNCTVNTVQTAGLPSGSIFPVGTTINKFLAIDASGNRDSISFTVTVKDNQLPAFAPIADISVNTDLNVCGAKVVYATPSATDNCSVSTVQTAGLPSGSTFPTGTTVNTFKATDASGNVSSISFTVTVTDIEKPKALAKNITISLVNGAASITAASIDNGSYDACGIKSLAVTGKTSYDCSSFGNHTVTLVVTDINNNVSTATAVVTVYGETTAASIASQVASSTFTGGNANNLYLGYGAQSTVLQATPTIVSSNAPVHSYTYQWSGNGTSMLSSTTSGAPVFTPTAAGSYTFMVKVTNYYGCSTTAAITICVKDIRVPGTNGQKVYVCHVPSGDLSKANTLSISVNAVSSHLGQHAEDKLGTCDQQCGTAAGNVIASSDGPKAGAEALSVSLGSELKATANVLTVYPNPFAFKTTVSFTLVQDEAKVSLDLYSLTGVKVRSVYSGPATAFKAESFSFETLNLPAGTYFFRLLGTKANLTFKVIIAN